MKYVEFLYDVLEIFEWFSNLDNDRQIARFL